MQHYNMIGDGELTTAQEGKILLAIPAKKAQ
jgi:hypothetical protein